MVSVPVTPQVKALRLDSLPGHPKPQDQVKMSSLTQLIKQRLTEAIVKVSAENPALNREGQPSVEEARDSFIAMLMAELFPEHGNESSAIVEVPVVEPVVPEASPVKKKLTKEEKEAAKAAKEAAKAAKEAAKAEKAASPKKSPEEKAAEKIASAEAKALEKEAKKAAEKAEKEAKKAADAAEKEAKKAEKEAKKAADAAEKEAKKEAKKKTPKPAAEVALPASPKPGANVAKIDPTWRKLLKEADKEHAKELEPELLKYLNNITNAVFHDKPARQHVTEFIESRKPAAEPPEMGVLEVVVFNGTDYYVVRETKRVYEGVMDAEGELKITRPVGYVGMADFKDMVLEDD